MALKPDAWPEDEIHLLRVVYPKFGPKGVQKYLPHRTIPAIRFQAYQRKIKVESEEKGPNVIQRSLPAKGQVVKAEIFPGVFETWHY